MTDLGLLGPENTYHDIARKRYLPHLSFTFFKTFDDVFEALKQRKIQKALVAIRNNTSGLVSNNLERIKSYGFHIREQFELPVHLYLGSKAPNTIQSIRKIYSHPMAIKETQQFFSRYHHITFIASTSTAGAIDELQNSQEKNAAVISSREALEKNNLLVILNNIEDHPDNTTTFSLIEG
jgi:prephenate dehydratase